MILSACTGQNVSMAFRTACPPVRGKCGLAKAFGVRSARRFRIAFRPRRLLPKKRREDAHALQKSRDCGTKHNGQNLRKLRKLSSIAPAKLPQLGGFFIAAFQLEHHPFNVPVILVPPQEL
jgi:hypothetical protein